MTGMVLNRDVDAKIYFGLSADEIKKYYDAHREKFRRPETVTLSEIFLSLAGKSDADVLAKAKDLVAQARKPGADFGALAAANSEREQNNVRVAQQTKGKLGAFQVPEISRADIAAAIKTVKAGGVTDPIHTDEGYLILRVDERTVESDTTFNENQVREAITAERAAKERIAYMQNLRRDAYIQIADNYRAAVTPFLSMGNPQTPSAASSYTTRPTPASNNTGGRKPAGGNKRP
jgi:parvulin-like peptidyl-prolyl isomerase